MWRTDADNAMQASHIASQSQRDAGFQQSAGSKGSGFLFANIKATTIMTVGNGHARGVSLQRNLNPEFLSLAPMAASEHIGYLAV